MKYKNRQVFRPKNLLPLVLEQVLLASLRDYGVGAENKLWNLKLKYYFNNNFPNVINMANAYLYNACVIYFQ